jgi:hypothetical protein
MLDYKRAAARAKSNSYCGVTQMLAGEKERQAGAHGSAPPAGIAPQECASHSAVQAGPANSGMVRPTLRQVRQQLHHLGAGPESPITCGALSSGAKHMTH